MNDYYTTTRIARFHREELRNAIRPTVRKGQRRWFGGAR